MTPADRARPVTRWRYRSRVADPVPVGDIITDLIVTWWSGGAMSGSAPDLDEFWLDADDLDADLICPGAECLGRIPIPRSSDDALPTLRHLRHLAQEHIAEAHRLVIDGEIAMSASVVKVTRSELEQRRAKLLGDLNLSLEELKARADTYSLTPEERAAWEKLQEIAFLLNER